MNDSSRRSSLIPDFLRHPAALFVAWVVPQLVLLCLNGLAWDLGSGEMTPRQQAEALRLGAAEGVILALGAGLSIGLAATRRRVGLGVCGVGLAVHVGYLWLFLARVGHVWPSAVTAWMLAPSTLIYYQFMLMMPAAFYCALRLACFDVPLRRGVDTAASLSTFLVVPVLWLLFIHFPRLFGLHWGSGLQELILLVSAVGSTIILLTAFLRVAFILYTWLAERRATSWIVPCLAGLVGPLAGLVLNRHIPFPCDFQSVGVYALTVINGVVLLLPSSPRAALGTTLWAARAVLYPFSVYFFAVFLPFLPLSLPALLCFGAGFLILSPTLLFAAHTQKLWRETTAIRQRFGTWRTLAALGVCLGLIPLLLTAEALFDRAALNNALNIVFAPDYGDHDPDVHPIATRRALAHLRGMKEGNYLPFITDAYNRLVFEGMALPDERVQTVHRVLFGTPPPPLRSRRQGLFLAPGINLRPIESGPSDAVKLQSVELSETPTKGLTRSSLVLSMKNDGPPVSEFAADLAIPRGVVVSGFRLKVNGELKDGRLVEKRTALWVYAMIRNATRRDPGLLVYTSPTTLRLRVYPFDAGETRLCEIELAFPQGFQPEVSVGGRSLRLGGDAGGEPAVLPLAVSASSNATHLVFTRSALAALPTVLRKPYLHFIVDNSRASAQAAARLADEVGRLARLAPPGAADRCRITLANYACASVGPDPIPLAAAAERVRAAHGRELPCRGGFRFDVAMAAALLWRDEETPPAAADATPGVPIFVVCPAAEDSPVASVDLTPFTDLAPDSPAYYLARGGQLRRVEFGGVASPSSDLEPPFPVVLLRRGSSWRVLAPDADLNAVAFDGQGRIEVLDGGRFRPLAVSDDPPADGFYAAALDLLELCRRTALNPGGAEAWRSDLVDFSQALRALTPVTAFMVVENSAQEKILTRKERQSLRAHAALDFEVTSTSASLLSTPEPGLLLMLPPVLGLLRWHHRRRRRSIGGGARG